MKTNCHGVVLPADCDEVLRLTNPKRPEGLNLITLYLAHDSLRNRWYYETSYACARRGCNSLISKASLFASTRDEAVQRAVADVRREVLNSAYDPCEVWEAKLIRDFCDQLTLTQLF